MGTSEQAVYLDYQSTTPIDKRVLETMWPYFREHFGNAHSTSHSFGWVAAEAVNTARRQLADSIHSDPDEIVFTSGATESINMALTGIVRASAVARPNVISVGTEHKASLAVLRLLQQSGCDVTLLPVNREGLLDTAQVEEAITPQTILVSVMAVNNEIGVIQPIRAIAKLCAERNIVFHTDAAQALGTMRINVRRDCLSLASFSSHKIYGPKGVGALYCKRDLQPRLGPLIHGGGQERGLRSGTLPVGLVVGFGQAAAIVVRERSAEIKRLSRLRKTFLRTLKEAIPDVVIHGSLHERVPGNLSLGFPKIDAEVLLGLMPNLALSLGSACTSAAPEPSHVLSALGVDYELASGSIRVGFGRPTTEREVASAVETIVAAVRRMREAV